MVSSTKSLSSTEIEHRSDGDGLPNMGISLHEEVDQDERGSISSEAQVPGARFTVNKRPPTWGGGSGGQQGQYPALMPEALLNDPQQDESDALPTLQLRLPPDTETRSFSEQFGDLVLSSDASSQKGPSQSSSSATQELSPSASQEPPGGEASTSSTRPHPKSPSLWQRLLTGRKSIPTSTLTSMPAPAIIERKLVTVGDTGCGKTPLLIAWSKGVFIELSFPTVFENYVGDVEVDGKQVELALWDTAGIENYDRLRPLSNPDTHVILLCFSLANSESCDNICEKVRGHPWEMSCRKPLMLV